MITTAKIKNKIETETEIYCPEERHIANSKIDKFHLFYF